MTSDLQPSAASTQNWNRHQGRAHPNDVRFLSRELKRLCAVGGGKLKSSIRFGEDLADGRLTIAELTAPDRLSGPDAVEQIRRERPNVKVILMTGFADANLLEGKPLADLSILEKPRAPEMLASRIREILARGREPCDEKGTA